ncbi:MAG: hypothetical protein SFW67_28495 [Myxococcaceae bacterium]|nr:hypothetical protein [Myxococcaceae bacterium]
MQDEAETTQVLEWSEAGEGLSSAARSRVLQELAAARAKDDEREGYFRDFKDATPDCAALTPSADIDKHAVVQANSGQRPWLAQAATLWGWLARAAMKQGPGVGAMARLELRVCLVRLAALLVAWIEAIDARDFDAGKKMMAPAPWWVRAWRWLRGSK